MKNEIIILLLFFWEKWIMISLFMRILKSFFSSLLLCIWPRPCLPRKKKLVPVRDFKTFPKVKTFFSFSTPNRLFFSFQTRSFSKTQEILTKNENNNSFFWKTFDQKNIEKCKSFCPTRIDIFDTVSGTYNGFCRTRINLFVSFGTLFLSTTQGSGRNYRF